ncbi:MAG: hypothetical protein ACJ8FK_02325, partial [Xanthobacteraceae bacterium]
HARGRPRFLDLERGKPGVMGRRTAVATRPLTRLWISPGSFRYTIGIARSAPPTNLLHDDASLQPAAPGATGRVMMEE